MKPPFGLNHHHAARIGGAILAAVQLVTSGCDQVSGDQGALTFTGEPGEIFDSSRPLALGTVQIFTDVSALGCTLRSTNTAVLNVELTEHDEARVTALAVGTARLECVADTVVDYFEYEVQDISDLSLYLPALKQHDGSHAASTFALISGREVRLSADLYGASRQELSHSGVLTVARLASNLRTNDSPLLAVSVGDSSYELEALQPGTAELELGAATWSGSRVYTVRAIEPAEVAQVTLASPCACQEPGGCEPLPTECVVTARFYTEDGLEVLDPAFEVAVSGSGEYSTSSHQITVTPSGSGEAEHATLTVSLGSASASIELDMQAEVEPTGCSMAGPARQASPYASALLLLALAGIRRRRQVHTVR